MKILLHTLFFFLLVTQIGFTQWYQQNSGTEYSLRGVEFIDENNGWAVGSLMGPNIGEVILSTTDSGINWTTQFSGYAFGLNSISFADLNHGIATCELV
jgi:photosystem II stability/assembly factor-like uncharacterized protein